jgi:hypothetical protein
MSNHKYYAYLFEQASLRAQQYNYQVAFQSLNKSELEKSLRLNVPWASNEAKEFEGFKDAIQESNSMLTS